MIESIEAGAVRAQAEYPEALAAAAPSVVLNFRPRDRTELDQIVQALGGIEEAGRVDTDPSLPVLHFAEQPGIGSGMRGSRILVWVPDAVAQPPARSAAPGMVRLRGEQIARRAGMRGVEGGEAVELMPETFDFLGGLPDHVVEDPEFVEALNRIAIGQPITPELRGHLIAAVEQAKKDREAVGADAR